MKKLNTLLTFVLAITLTGCAKQRTAADVEKEMNDIYTPKPHPIKAMSHEDLATCATSNWLLNQKWQGDVYGGELYDKLNTYNIETNYLVAILEAVYEESSDKLGDVYDEQFSTVLTPESYFRSVIKNRCLPEYELKRLKRKS